MVIESARRAARQIFDPPMRGVLFKSLGLTVAVLAAMWFAVTWGASGFLAPWIGSFLPTMPDSLPDWLPTGLAWLGTVFAIIAGIGLALGLAMLVAPVTALVASVFLDDIADVIERDDYPDRKPGTALPMVAGIWMSAKFLVVVALANIVALLMLLIPGVNMIAFFVVNGYLLGREYFEFAAMRHLPEHDAKALRRRHSTDVFLAGLIIAAVLAIPLVNLLTPIFAATMMVHLHQSIVDRLPPVGEGTAAMRKAA